MSGASPGRPRIKGRRSRPQKGIGRHFDGWQAGAIAVLLAASTAALVVPQSVSPVDVPEPLIDPQEAFEVEANDVELAQLAQSEGLPIGARSLGSAVREVGGLEVIGNVRAMGGARAKVVHSLGSALREGPEHVFRLRAYQMFLFLDALDQWSETGLGRNEIEQLAGPILDLLERHGWLDPETRQVRVSDRVLKALYKKRWNIITDFTGTEARLSVVEERILLQFFLEHPAVEPEASPEDTRRAQDRYRLRKVVEHGERDPAYPSELARGVLHFRLAEYGPAAQSFERYLDTRPDGPHTLRAQNYLRAALERM